MIRASFRHACVVAGMVLSAVAAAQPARRTGVVRVEGRTVVAFFPAVTQAQVDSGGELAEVLDDFQYHIAGARRALARRGVRVVEVYADTIRLAVDGRTREFVPPRDSAVGYYFVAPGRRPVIRYGVMTDSDLTDEAIAIFKPPGRAAK